MFEFENGNLSKQGFITNRFEYNKDGYLIKQWNPDTNFNTYNYHMSPEFLIDSTTYKYDNVNRIISENTFYRAGTDSDKFEYDSLGRLISVTVYLDTVLINQYKFEYNKANKIFKEFYTSDLNNRETGYIYYFDDNDRIKRSFHFWNGGTKKRLTSKYIYFDNIIIEIEYTPKGFIKQTNKYYYDRKHNLIRFVRDHGKFIMDENYKYDDNGNEIYRKWFKITYDQFRRISKVYWEISFKSNNTVMPYETLSIQNDNLTSSTKKYYEYFK
jgi:YD repeat-containing protein